MSTLFTLDFEGQGTDPSNGDAMTDANTGCTNMQVAGGGAATFTTAQVHEGSLAGDFACATSGTANTRHAGYTANLAWTVAYVYWDGVAPSTNAVILEAWNPASVLGAVRLTTGGTLQARDGTTADFTSDALTAGWHRLAWLIDPAGDTHRLKIYSLGNVDGDTPDQDSGDMALTLTAGDQWVDTIKTGVVTTAVLSVIFDGMVVDDAEEWFPSTEPPAAGRPIEYTFQGGDATDIANWV